MIVESLEGLVEQNKRYDIIYIDPPWTYRDLAKAGKRGASFKYPLMNETELENLPMKKIASENSLLFCWVTMPKLDEVFSLIDLWGFTYKTNAFTWIKLNKKSLTPFFGMGRWTRANAEICLIATRGKPKRVSASVSSVIMAPIGKHSAKPPEVRERIVELCGDISRIEIFARYDENDKTFSGWDTWGNGI